MDANKRINQFYRSVLTSTHLVRQLAHQIEVAQRTAVSALHRENLMANYEVYRISLRLYDCHQERVKIAQELGIESPLIISGFVAALSGSAQHKIESALSDLETEMAACSQLLDQNQHIVEPQYQIMKDLTNPISIEMLG